MCIIDYVYNHKYTYLLCFISRIYIFVQNNVANKQNNGTESIKQFMWLLDYKEIKKQI
jgi:hypothetical protein